VFRPDVFGHIDHGEEEGADDEEEQVLHDEAFHVEGYTDRREVAYRQQDDFPMGLQLPPVAS